MNREDVIAPRTEFMRQCLVLAFSRVGIISSSVTPQPSPTRTAAMDSADMPSTIDLFRRLALSFVSAIVISLVSPESHGQDVGKAPLPATITEDLRRDIQFLASEELRGRSVADETIHQAAAYLEDRMVGIGLQMDSVDGTGLQDVEITIGSEVASEEKNRCRFSFPNGTTVEATLEDGFGPLSVGKDVGTADGRVVFVGYGITSEVHQYDDYKGIDARGAIAMILRKEPRAADPNSPFDGVKNTRHAYFATKISNAISHGAVGVLFINDPRSTGDAAAEVQNQINQELRRREALAKTLADLPPEAINNRKKLAEQIEGVDRIIESSKLELRTARRGVFNVGDAGTKTKQSAKLPIASIARDTANRLLVDSGGPKLTELEARIDETLRPASRALPGVRADMSVELKPAVSVSPNVIGRLPGRGALATETIVVGAHYDHVGMGGFASLAPGTIAVHNGADDNASGTATMLACATLMNERLASHASHRTMLFIAFTGEERGLLGSEYYVRHPVRPIETTAAMINLDMVGRLRDNELTVYGTGSAVELNGLLEKANQAFGFSLYKVASGFGPSDHQSFYRVGVPVMFFFTGLHNDYHRPSDDFDKIDFNNLTRVTDIVSDVAFRLAVLPQRPRYSETDNRVQIRRQMTAYLGVRVSSRGGAVQITEVTDGGPASQAGLRIGDELQRIGKRAIRSTNDLLSWVRAHGPGDTFEIIVRRNGSPVTLRGELEKRPDG